MMMTDMGNLRFNLSSLDSSLVPLHRAVNDMDNAIYEIDVYDPGLFMKIERELRTVI